MSVLCSLFLVDGNPGGVEISYYGTFYDKDDTLGGIHRPEIPGQSELLLRNSRDIRNFYGWWALLLLLFCVDVFIRPGLSNRLYKLELGASLQRGAPELAIDLCTVNLAVLCTVECWLLFPCKIS